MTKEKTGYLVQVIPRISLIQDVNHLKCVMNNKQTRIN